MHPIVDLIEYLFSNKKTLVYTTFSQKDYYRVVGKLREHEVKYRVATSTNHTPGGTYSDMDSQYKIYVAKRDESKAGHAMNS